MSLTTATFRTYFSLNAKIFLFLLVGKGGISIIDLLPPNLITSQERICLLVLSLEAFSMPQIV